MTRISLLAIGLVISVSTLSLDASAKDWADLPPGDTLYFLLPASAEPPAPFGAQLIFAGGKIIDIDATECGGGIQPVQHYTLVDTTGEKSAKSGGIIPLGFAEPVRPGTRISDPIADMACHIGDVNYVRWQGTVQ